MDNYRRERDTELNPVARWFTGECEKQWEKRQEEGEKKRRIELMNRHKAVPDKGGFRPMKNYKLDVDHLNAIEEQTPDWLILDYVPMYQITTLAGDGGSGKTTVWCALTAAVSSGKKSFFESFLPED